tara:strand:- start:69 stop:272 length:204 start_codon:yes stop_codon:yes gene_type:complete
MKELPPKRKILAIVTGGISVLIGILYLVLITFLDARGPMLPPPPEAFGAVGVVVASDEFLSAVLQLF